MRRSAERILSQICYACHGPEPDKKAHVPAIPYHK
jgi:hypothetical protein